MKTVTLPIEEYDKLVKDSNITYQINQLKVENSGVVVVRRTSSSDYKGRWQEKIYYEISGLSEEEIVLKLHRLIVECENTRKNYEKLETAAENKLSQLTDRYDEVQYLKGKLATAHEEIEKLKKGQLTFFQRLFGK